MGTTTIVEKRGAGVARALRTSLLDGEFEPGERLNEVQIAARYGVSRTPVRTALQQLAGEGLVEYRDNRGFFVRQFAVADVIDAFEMRALAEGLAARLAAERGLSPEDEIEIEKALEEGDAGLQLSDPAEARSAYSAANDRFHGTIQRAARSRLVADVIALCNTIPQTLSQNVMSFSVEAVQPRAHQHHEIYSAILARKPREAEELMRAHVLDVRHAVARDFARAGRGVSGEGH
jgi:GntR family transcriptional regulator of vanillate catabolism